MHILKHKIILQIKIGIIFFIELLVLIKAHVGTNFQQN